jgi:hypothetical protein
VVQVPPASPDVPDATDAVDSALEPLRSQADVVDRELRDNEAFLQQRRSRGVDREVRSLLERAADSTSAPSSLRRLARRVAAGELTWDDVFAHRAGPDGDAFLTDAFATARRHFADADLAPVKVPEEALAVNVDPAAIATDIDQTMTAAREAHDRIFRRAFEDTP